MKIVLHGQQAFGQAVLERLLERKENVIAVCTAPDQAGRPVDPLKGLAQQYGIPVHQPASWKTAEAVELMQSFEADICMMAYVLLFVPSTVLNVPRYGSFQYHPSLLPMHRGPSSINWPISMGATKTGLSIFWPDDGLDEGPILMQKHCDIGPDETLGDVYFKKLFPMGVEAMLESLDLVRSGEAPRIEQNLDAGSYESWFGKQQAKLHWNDSVSRVYNIIRAANPQPGAWTTNATIELQTYAASKHQGVGKPGEVIVVNDDGFEVAANGGSIRVAKVRASGAKLSAAEWAKQVELKAGQVFGA